MNAKKKLASRNAIESDILVIGAGMSGLYICGETYCADQTWVNGALRSVEQMFGVSEAFKVPPLDLNGLSD
jgi:hypothetical protein